MSTPNVTDNYRGYEESDLTKHADLLRDKQYLLVHGTADDNVHMQQSMTFAKSLTSRGVLFKQQIYTDEGHDLIGVKRHLYRSMTTFFEECFKRLVGGLFLFVCIRCENGNFHEKNLIQLKKRNSREMAQKKILLKWTISTGNLFESCFLFFFHSLRIFSFNEHFSPEKRIHTPHTNNQSTFTLWNFLSVFLTRYPSRRKLALRMAVTMKEHNRRIDPN